MTGATTLTQRYEAWLAEQIPVVRADLVRKHHEMRDDRFRFLRGTYYLWLVRLQELLPEVLDTAEGITVGDLHVENFGTWRDRSGVRRWGVNDFDELGRAPWLIDPLRLATSAVLSPHLGLSHDDACDLVLTTWRGAEPGRAIDLRDREAAHLRALVPPLEDARTFYRDLRAGTPAEVPAELVSAAAADAEAGWKPSWFARSAGTGSLGHQRYVGVGKAADGRWHAREVKQLGPPTVTWLHAAAPVDESSVIKAVRGPAQARRVDGWQIRDLAPDAVRISLAGLPPKDSRQLVRSMAAAGADVQGVDAGAFARREKVTRKAFRRYVAVMADSVREDWAAYRG